MDKSTLLRELDSITSLPSLSKSISLSMTGRRNIDLRQGTMNIETLKSYFSTRKEIAFAFLFGSHARGIIDYRQKIKKGDKNEFTNRI